MEDPKAVTHRDLEEKGSGKPTPETSPEKEALSVEQQPGRGNDAAGGNVELAPLLPTAPGEATMDPAVAFGEANGGGALNADHDATTRNIRLMTTFVVCHFGGAYSLAGSPMTLKTNNVLKVHVAATDGVAFKTIVDGGYLLVNKTKYQFCECPCEDKTIGGAHYLVVTVDVCDEVKAIQLQSGLALHTAVDIHYPKGADGVPVVASLHVDTTNPESMFNVKNYEIHSGSVTRLGDPSMSIPCGKTNHLECWCCLELKKHREILSLVTSWVPALVVMLSYAYAVHDRINDFKLTTKIIQGFQVGLPVWVKLSETNKWLCFVVCILQIIVICLYAAFPTDTVPRGLAGFGKSLKVVSGYSMLVPLGFAMSYLFYLSLPRDDHTGKITCRWGSTPEETNTAVDPSQWTRPTEPGQYGPLIEMKRSHIFVGKAKHLMSK